MRWARTARHAAGWNGNLGKGSQTTSTNSTSSPDPQAYQAYSNLLQRAQGVASTPYQAYSGELTAPVNSQQQTGISGINASANYAQPYIQQAAGMASSAANPLTQQQIQNYQNPYTQNVVDATQAQFNNQNQQAQQGLTSNAIASGALGGNRTGVASANLANQQQLAQAPTIANLYSQSYQQGLQTAQQQYQTNPEAAAGQIANYGISGQSAALSGAQAQLNAGTLQQQTQQAADTANYGQYQQAQAYPYQQTQWLAGLATGVGSNMGGTSSGSTTSPAPNQTSQWLGAGLSAAGLFLNRGGAVKGYANGGVVPQHMADGGASSTPWSGGVGWIPSLQIHGGSGAPHSSAPSSQQQQSSSGDASKIASGISGLGNKGIGDTVGSWFNPEAYGGADGGQASAYGGSSTNPLAGLSAADYGEGFARGGVVGYANGGAPDFYDRFAPAVEEPFGDMTRGEALAHQMRQNSGVAAPVTTAPPTDDSNVPIYDDGQGPVRLYGQHPEGNPDAMKATGVSAKPDDTDSDVPEAATPTSGSMPAGVAPAQFKPPYEITPADYAPPRKDPENTFGLGWLSPNAKAGLLTAGLGMLASRSPFLGNAIGEGGLAGLSAYGSAEEKDRKAAEEAQKLSLEAKQAANTLAHQTFQTNESARHAETTEAETARHNRATEEKEYKPTLVNDVDPNTGETRHMLFDPNKKTLTPLQAPLNEAANSAGSKFVSTAPPAEERRKAPQASPEARDESFYKYMQNNRPPGYADIVRGVADYEIDPNKEASLQKGARDRLYRDVKQYDPTYDQTHFAEKSGVIQNFSRGPASQAVNSLNVSVAHLGTLAALGDALQNGNIPLANKIGNSISVWTGKPAVTNFEAAKEIVGDEVVKAVVGGVNSQADREAIKHLILAQQTPAQLKGVIQTFTTLLGGQLDGQRQRYQAGTGLNNFDQKYLAPATREALARGNGPVDPSIAKMVYPSGIPKEGAAAPAGGGAPMPAPQTKTINGVTYVNRNGQWYQQ